MIHIDSYGNVVTNITRGLYDEVIKGRPFRISFGRTMHDITELNNTYTDVPPGERVAFFGGDLAWARTLAERPGSMR